MDGDGWVFIRNSFSTKTLQAISGFRWRFFLADLTKTSSFQHLWKAKRCPRTVTLPFFDAFEAEHFANCM